MAEGNDPTQGTEGGNQPDYEALYEEAKRRARDWEKKAKANKGAATALDEANAAKQTAARQPLSFPARGGLRQCFSRFNASRVQPPSWVYMSIQ